ncbi:hypothetical protein Z042_15465 [Chania multitudinisentens RB-25]|uniref:Uncharacterized protein n=1 Tax=Chania multitudinisentens RB-25 TaxID=1441930 RepID=W0LKJ5_9GAMM|nr:hypothetical protein [Chania multitudinisentens]AHG22847.1 hypothetical protein Z042_15465 [Chania multitudinisentens RB-25]
MIRIKKYAVFIILLYLFNGYCYAEKVVTDNFTFKDYEIALVQVEEHCQLNISSSTVKKTYPLTLTAPCHFLRDTNAEPQKYRYSDVSIEAIFVISGNPVTKQERETWNLSPEMLCGMQGQGLLFDGTDFSISKKKLNNILLCKDKGTDEKNYWMLSH